MPSSLLRTREWVRQAALSETLTEKQRFAEFLKNIRLKTNAVSAKIKRNEILNQFLGQFSIDFFPKRVSAAKRI